MKKWTSDLLTLQSIDIRIRNLKTKLETIPMEKNNLKSELNDAAEIVKKAKAGIQKTELGIKKVESDIAAANEGMRKLQTQSTMVKKNTEYQAMLSEVEKMKARISDLETDQLLLMDELDAAKNAFKKIEADYAAQERNVKTEYRELLQLEADIKQEIETALSERKGFESKIESSYLSVYARLLSKGKGTPVSTFVQGNTCSNCSLKLTPQTLNDAKKGNLALCDNCSCIIYDPDAPSDYH